MGNQLVSSVRTVIRPIDFYLNEVPDLKYKSSLGQTQFLKVALCAHSEGDIVVKVLSHEDPSLLLEPYRKELLQLAQITAKNVSIASFRIVEVKTNFAYMARQYIRYSLYDRLSTRPFLTDVEKAWITFQILKCFEWCHQKDIFHGDIKLENILVTSNLWVVVADFASFKPVYLTDDNPTFFNYFFDTSRRRCCNISPERFFAQQQQQQTSMSGSSSQQQQQQQNVSIFSSIFMQDGQLTWQMDMFSLGCILAEMYSDNYLFDLGSLINYKKYGKLDEHSEECIDRIQCEPIKAIVKNLISIDPEQRKNCTEVLSELNGTFFPNYFEKLYYIMDSLIRLPPDSKILYLSQDLNYCLDLICKENAKGILIVLMVITSSMRSLKHVFCKLEAQRLICKLAMSSPILSPFIADRLIPYLVHCLNDNDHRVRGEAIDSITLLLEQINHLPASDNNLFTDYLMEKFQKCITNEKSIYVRICMAKNIGRLSSIAMNFLYQYCDQNYDEELQLLHKYFQSLVSILITDTNNCVRRVLLMTPNNCAQLCTFFGRQKTNEVILSHIITFLNDKNDFKLRISFFDNIVVIASYLGVQCSNILLPLLQQGLCDAEEIIIAKTIHAMGTLVEQGLLSGNAIVELLKECLPLIYHPNLWITNAVSYFLVNIHHHMSLLDLNTKLYPHIESFASLTSMLVNNDDDNDAGDDDDSHGKLDINDNDDWDDNDYEDNDSNKNSGDGDGSDADYQTHNNKDLLQEFEWQTLPFKTVLRPFMKCFRNKTLNCLEYEPLPRNIYETVLMCKDDQVLVSFFRLLVEQIKQQDEQRFIKNKINSDGTNADNSNKTCNEESNQNEPALYTSIMLKQNLIYKRLKAENIKPIMERQLFALQDIILKIYRNKRNYMTMINQINSQSALGYSYHHNQMNMSSSSLPLMSTSSLSSSLSAINTSSTASNSLFSSSGAAVASANAANSKYQQMYGNYDHIFNTNLIECKKYDGVRSKQINLVSNHNYYGLYGNCNSNTTNQEWLHMFGPNSNTGAGNASGSSQPSALSAASPNITSTSTKDDECSSVMDGGMLSNDECLNDSIGPLLKNLKAPHEMKDVDYLYFECPPYKRHIKLLEHHKRTTFQPFSPVTNQYSQQMHRPRGYMVAHLAEHKSSVNKMARFQQSTLFVTCSDDGSIRLWDLCDDPSRYVITRSSFDFHMDFTNGTPVNFKSIINCGPYLITCSNDCLIHVFELRQTQLVLTCSFKVGPSECSPPMTISSICSLSQTMFAVALSNSLIYIYDVRQIYSPLFNVPVIKLQTSPMQRVITCIAGNTLILFASTACGYINGFDLRFNLKVSSYFYNKQKSTPITHICYTPTGLFSSVYGSCDVTFWDYKLGQKSKILSAENIVSGSKTHNKQTPANSPYVNTILPIMTNDHSMSIITAGSDMRIRYWDINDPERSYIISDPLFKPCNYCFNNKQQLHHNSGSSNAGSSMSPSSNQSSSMSASSRAKTSTPTKKSNAEFGWSLSDAASTNPNMDVMQSCSTNQNAPPTTDQNQPPSITPTANTTSMNLAEYRVMNDPDGVIRIQEIDCRGQYNLYQTMHNCTMDQQLTPFAHQDTINDLLFINQYLISCAQDGVVKVWR